MSNLEPPRYALYFAPAPSSDLWQRASALLGYDAARGCDVDAPTLAGISASVLAHATEKPRRYGFHATLKQPIVLREGMSEEALRDSLHHFCASEAPFTGPKLSVGPVRGFLALVPTAACPALDQFAGRVVSYFEGYRAPLTEADLRRRLSSPLTARMRRSLERWGYPYVFADLSFHMTLTGPTAPGATAETYAELSRHENAELQRAMAGFLAPALQTPLAIDRLCLFRQERRDRRFVMIEQVELGSVGSSGRRL